MACPLLIKPGGLPRVRLACGRTGAENRAGTRCSSGSAGTRSEIARVPRHVTMSSKGRRGPGLGSISFVNTPCISTQAPGSASILTAPRHHHDAPLICSIIESASTMAAKQGVFTEKAPRPLPQFSQAVKYNGNGVLLGQHRPRCPDGQTGRGDRQGQGREFTDRLPAPSLPVTILWLTTPTPSFLLSFVQRQSLKNLSAILDEAGSSLANVVKMNVS